MGFNVRLRNLFYIISAIVLVWFLYMEREILAPFLLAMIFAYIFNPLISYLQKRMKVPRIISIIIVYILVIGTAVFLSVFFTKSLINESQSIASNLNQFIASLRVDVSNLPYWIKPYIGEYLDYFSKNQLVSGGAISPFPLFSKAFTGIFSFFIFLFVTFFFLKEGDKMGNKFLLFFPNEYRLELSILGRKINSVLSGYLRGQLLLIFSMMVMLFIAFTILGVKYAITISLISALLEIIPLFGPVAGGVFGSFIVIISGGIFNFHITIFQTILIMAALYIITRLIQDYFIMPIVMGKVTKLNPLVILFSVIAGSHIYGVIGVIFSVPVAAVIKIVYQFFLDKINEKDSKNTKVY